MDVSALTHAHEVLGKLDDLADAASDRNARIRGTVRLSLSFFMAHVLERIRWPCAYTHRSALGSARRRRAG